MQILSKGGQQYIEIDDVLRQVKKAQIDAASAGDNQIVAAVPGFKIRVLAIKFSVASDVTTSWMSGLAGGASQLWPAETWKAGGGMSDAWGPICFFFETLTGEALNLYLGGAVQVSGGINYIEV